MNKYLVLLMVFGLLTLTACSNSETSSDIANNVNANTEIKNQLIETSESIDDIMNRYAGFESSMGCALATAGLEEDPNAIFEAMSQTEEFATNFGFTADEIAPLTEKYSEDSVFLELVQEKMSEICPEVLAKIQE